MKRLLFILLFCHQIVNGTSYFVSSSKGSDKNNGTDNNIAWRSLGKIQDAISKGSVKSGDAILFMANDTFTGKLDLANKISMYLGRYGSGNNPVITGMVDISGPWSYYAPNIYRKKVTSANIRYVTINGIHFLIGKFPSTGWNTITGGSSQTYLQDAKLKQPDDYWNGAEVVFKNSKYWFNVRTVTDFTQSNGRVIFDKNSTYKVEAGYGYFFQNHYHCLIKKGDWSFDGTYLYLYYPGNPASLSICASQFETALSIGEKTTVENLTITGYNNIAIALIGGKNNLAVKNCTISFCSNGICGSNTNNISIENNYLSNIGDKGIDITYAINATITGNTLKKVGIVPGFGSIGLWGIRLMNVNSSKAYYNDLDSIGYCGIIFGGINGGEIRYNRIKNYCMLGDDGGGIYMQGCGNGIITNNFIQGSGGDMCLASAKWKDYANMGIYLDGTNNHIEIADNLSVGSRYNIYLNPCSYISIINNLTCKHKSDEGASGELFLNSGGSFYKVESNKFVTNFDNDRHAAWSMFASSLDGTSSFKSNYYLLPTGQKDGKTSIINYNGKKYTVFSWLNGNYGMNEKADMIKWNDALAGKMVKKDFVDYEYNFSDKTVRYVFKGNYVYYDLDGKKLNEYYLKPFTGAILLKVYAKSSANRTKN